jgi:hypothetical protein
MRFKEFDGEIDAPIEDTRSEAPRLREFTGRLDSEAPDTGDEAARLAARYKAPSSPSFLDRVTDAAKEVGNAVLGRDPNPTVRNGRSVLEGSTWTPQDEAANAAQRLSLSAGPISRETAAKADQVRAGRARTTDRTVQKAAQAMALQNTPSATVVATRAKEQEATQVQAEAQSRRDFADENPIMGALGSGAANALSGAINIPSVAADFVNETAVNPVLQAFGLEKLKRAPTMVGTEYLTKSARDFMPKEGREDVDSAWRREEFAQWLGVKLAANALPMAQSLAAAFSPALRSVLLPSMAGTAAGSSFVQGDDSRIAVAKGGIEYLSEKLPLQAFDKIGEVLKNMGPTKSSAVLAMAGQRLLQTGGAITANGLTGAIEESAAQLGGNALDKFFAGKDIELTKGLAESAVVGAASGGAMSLPQVAGIASGQFDSNEMQLARAMDRETRDAQWANTPEAVAVDRLNPNIYRQTGGFESAIPAPAPAVESFTPADSPSAQAGLAPIVVPVPEVLPPLTTETGAPVGMAAPVLDDGQAFDLQQPARMDTEANKQAIEAPAPTAQAVASAPTAASQEPAIESPATVLAPNGQPFSSKQVATVYAQQQGMAADHLPVKTQGGWALEPVAKTLTEGSTNPQQMAPDTEAGILSRINARTQAAPAVDATPAPKAAPAATDAPATPTVTPTATAAPVADAVADETLMAPSGKPFSTQQVAKIFAKQQGITDFSPVQVEGGWALKATASAPNAVATPMAQAQGVSQGMTQSVDQFEDYTADQASDLPRTATPGNTPGGALRSMRSQSQAPDTLTITNSAGKPFATEKSAALHIQAKGIERATVTKVDGGYVVEALAEPDAAPLNQDAAGMDADSASNFRPDGSVFTMQGSRRSPEGFQTAGDAQMATQRARRIRPDLDFRVEQKPNGLFMLAGYPKDAAKTDAAKATTPDTDKPTDKADTPDTASDTAKAEAAPEKDEAPAQGEQDKAAPAAPIVTIKRTRLGLNRDGDMAAPDAPAKPNQTEQDPEQDSEQADAPDTDTNTEATPEPKRGADAVEEGLITAARNGRLTPEALSLALYLIRKNRAMATDLGFVQTEPKMYMAAAEYIGADRLFSVAADVTSDPTVAAHEILHHSEQMMPKRVRDGIQRQWRAALTKAIAASTGDTRTALELIPKAIAGDTAAEKAIEDAFDNGVLRVADHYELVTPSEYWAVNASRILTERHAADSWIAQARQWLKELIIRLKSLATTASDDAVISGLSAIMKTDGTYTSDISLDVMARYIAQARAGGAMGGGTTGSGTMRARRHTDGGVGFADSGIQMQDWTKASQLRANMQDRFIRVKHLQTAIENVTGMETPETQDVYMAEELSYGRAQEMQDKFKEQAVQPLIDQMNKDKLTLDEVSLYAYAKHTPERNAHLKKRGVVDGSGMSDKQAEAVLAAFQEAGKAEALEQTHKRLMAITQAARDLQLKEGLISQSQYDRWQKVFKNYVPLKGRVLQDIDPTTGDIIQDDSTTDLPQSSGWEITGPQSLPALGRQTQASQIVENAIANYSQAVNRGVKNGVGKALVALADANPDPSLWEFVSQPGDDTFSVKMQGQDVHLRIKDAQLLMALKQDDGAAADAIMASKTVELMGKWTRYSSQTLTRYNPAFGFVNAARDLQWAGAVAFAELGTMGAANYTKHYANLTQSGPAWEEFKASGATTGGFQTADAGRIGADIQDLIDNQAKGMNIKRMSSKGLNRTLGALEWIGNRGELQARYALFRAGRDAGMSVAKAASLSKSSMNFNRRGRHTRVFGSAYMFFNAGVQGAHSFGRLLGNRRFQYLLGAQVAAGAAMVAMNVEIMGVDDDMVPLWDKVSDSDKARNFIIGLPPGTEINAATGKVARTGRYIKIPLAIPMAAINRIGQSLADVARHKANPRHGITAGKAASNIVSGMFGAFNPVGGEFDPTKPEEWAIKMSPLIASQAFQLGFGVNPFGGKTDTAKDWNEDLPDSEKVSTNKYGGSAHRIARYLNEETGGKRYMPGGIDVTPGAIEQVAGMATGGVGRTAVGVFDLVEAMLGDEPIDPTKTVVAKSFVGNVTADREVGRFYAAKDEIDKIKAQDRAAAKLGEQPDWTPDEQQVLSLAKDAQSMAHDLAKVNAAIRETIDSKKLTDKERDLKVKMYKAQKAAMADQFMNAKAIYDRTHDQRKVE